ncbi:MAG: APC family permease [Alphaproteobacteria bacterium]|nr:APC family permease [Alphaproteobacteria bacterium]MDE2042012.1 APC family permease [Alphaproteobacteria bacterium]MDE2341527.1 APC family permease [Alphaproteobacteria bacterium]
MNDAPRSNTGSPQKFTRALSGFGVIILTLSVLSPGVSVFVSGASIVQQAGSGAVLAFLIGGIVCYVQTSLGAELGAAYPTAGYDYASIGNAVGDWAGALTYIVSLVTLPMFLNTSAVGIAEYLHPIFPGINDTLVTLITVGVVTLAALLNIRANEFITGIFMLIETAALLLVSFLGIAHTQPDAVQRIFHPMHMANGVWVAAGIGVIGVAVNSAAWAIAGATQALMFSEDMKKPQTVGRIIMLAFFITVVLECAPVAGTIIGAHNAQAVLSNKAPFETFLAESLPDFALKLVSLSIAIAIFNACLAGFVGIGRNVYAMGRTNLFAAPINRALMRLTPRAQAPWVALLIIGMTTAAATFLSMKFKILMLAGNYTILTIFYAWGVWRGRRMGRTGQPHHLYRSPAFPLMVVLMIPILVLEIAALWTDTDTGRPSLFIFIGLYLLAFLYYRFVLLRRPDGWRMEGPADIDALEGR